MKIDSEILWKLTLDTYEMLDLRDILYHAIDNIPEILQKQAKSMHFQIANRVNKKE